MYKNHPLFPSLSILLALASASLSSPVMATPFDMQPHLNPVITVPVNGSGTSYNASLPVNVQKSVQVRGRCMKEWKIERAALDASGGEILLKDRSSGHRSLTANNGASWESVQVPISINGNNSAFAQRCNAEAQQRLNTGQPASTVFGQGFTMDAGQSESVSLNVSCYDQVGVFKDPDMLSTITRQLPVRLHCTSTGFQPPQMKVKSVRLKLAPKASLVTGLCQLGVTGKIRTNYPAVSAATGGASRLVQYRYHFRNVSTGHATHSEWLNQTFTGNQNGQITLNRTSEVPTAQAKSVGEVWVEVKTVGNFFNSKKKRFDIDCAEPFDVSLNTHIPAKATLRIEAIKATRAMRNGQLCPTQVRVLGHITAGTAQLQGQAVFAGETIADMQSYPLNMAPQSNRSLTFVRPLQWPAAGTSLAGNTQSNVPRSVTFQYRLNVIEGDTIRAQVLPRNYTFACEIPPPSTGLGLQAPGGTVPAVPSVGRPLQQKLGRKPGRMRPSP